ncbi:NAD(P)H-dependent oxidoreductase [Methyloversatilis universalis]|uniref:NAD(P)H-dependent oxidoreductase n=1 Tax=Methyloversatilis universalis TaxID=378211 RepID=UPI000369E9A4|nr:NAD(P)H-dependent oxidoreductase [Methyloversatilis universalis]
MKVLIVHAHPEPQSFSAAMCRTAVGTLAAQGHTVTVSDLYAQRFNPVASAADFAERRNPDYLNYALEQRHAQEGGTLAPDIRAEVDKVLACDLLILNFPIYWFSVPAMLKGWIDRVFVSGVFYGGKRIYDRGGLRGRRALVAASLGGREHMFGPQALHGELNGMLRHVLQGSLGYVGFDVLEPFYAHHVPYLPEAERAAMLEHWRAALGALDARPTLPMPSLDRFDDTFRPLAGA